MKPSIATKLQTLDERMQEVRDLLSDPDIIGDNARFRDLSREYSELEPIVECFTRYRQSVDEADAASEMRSDADPEIRSLALEELAQARQLQEDLEAELQRLLLPRDPSDGRNIYLEIRAGTGGDEASIFAGDLLRMYSRYAENQGWQIEIVTQHAGEMGGFKEVITRVVGRGVYARLKFESGGHRVQRVPETESQGRIHTSACTVAIMPEVDDVPEIELSPADLRVDTFRASGAGGQHVNKTDSAIRITHLPSGTVVECQDERSQHKNRARALSLLKARLMAVQQEKLAAEQAEDRKGQVGSGDRSQRIRTYNFPQGRVTDHRINLTLYKLSEVMQGALDSVIDPLIHETQAAQLAAMGE